MSRHDDTNIAARLGINTSASRITNYKGKGRADLSASAEATAGRRSAGRETVRRRPFGARAGLIEGSPECCGKCLRGSPPPVVQENHRGLRAGCSKNVQSPTSNSQGDSRDHLGSWELELGSYRGLPCQYCFSDLRRGLRLHASQGREQLRRIDWFADVIVHASFETFLAVAGERAGGHRNDRH